MNDETDPLGVELSRAQDSGQVFAVVDAAHFEYLQDTLTMERFKFDPLYLDEIDNASIASGPHLVHVTGPSQIAKLREIIGDKPACVWCVWPDELGAGEAIHRHVRGLNMVEIPKDRFDQDNEDERGPGYEAVLFRHADADVMTSMLPTLYLEQVLRLFGEAQQIIAVSRDFNGCRVFAKPEGSHSKPGLLRLEKAQYDLLGSARQVSTELRIGNYLRHTVPEKTSHFSDAELQKIAQDRIEEARGFGVKSEGALGRWCYLQMITDGQLTQVAGVRDYMFGQDGVAADQKVSLLLKSLTRAAISEGR